MDRPNIFSLRRLHCSMAQGLTLERAQANRCSHGKLPLEEFLDLTENHGRVCVLTVVGLGMHLSQPPKVQPPPPYTPRAYPGCFWSCAYLFLGAESFCQFAFDSKAANPPCPRPSPVYQSVMNVCTSVRISSAGDTAFATSSFVI